MKTPTALANLRHLYQQMLDGNVKDTAEAAKGLLGPAIAVMEKMFLDDSYERKEINEKFDEWLKDIEVVDNKGELNKTQALLELKDYYFILKQISKVYCHVTGGKLSKPNYYANTIITVSDDCVQEQIDDAVKEALEFYNKE